MKVLSVVRADSVRAVRTIGGPIGYLPNALAALIAKYAFVGIPTPVELLPDDPNKGVLFKHGKLQSNGSEILIDFLQIFPTGLSVTTRSNTSDADIVVDDVLAWAASEFKIGFEDIKQGIAHTSQLEVRLEKSLADLIPFLSDIGNAITKGLDEQFWEFNPSYEFTGLQFWFDRTKFPQFAPPLFRIERRNEIPFEQNVYYCEAPMSTDNHVTVLSRFERICLERFK